MKDLVRIFNSLDDIEIAFFDDDPDGDPDRAGDGWYFQISGEDDWSGAWHSEDEAMEMAILHLKEAEENALFREATRLGYLCADHDGTLFKFVNKIDGRWFRLNVDFEERRVHVREVMPEGPSSTVYDSEIDGPIPPETEGEAEFGHVHAAARAAFEAVEALFAPTSVLARH